MAFSSPLVSLLNGKEDKMNDQTAKADAGKLQLTLCPRGIILAITKVRMFGTSKYGDKDNWKKVEPQRYKDAAFRHFLAFLDNPFSKDEESGLPHLWHLACNIAFLIELCGNGETNDSQGISERSE